MIINKYDHHYFRWLCDMVHCGEKNRYSKLTTKLHSIPYTYNKTNLLLMRDSSREDDGLTLRDEYINDKHNNITSITGECSIFEMLIALSRRIDDLCSDSLIDPNIDKWFWRLLKNLKLDKYDDFNYNDEEVVKIINTFTSRKYDKCGNGGLFPIQKYKGDMRKIDIATQMHHYLNVHEYSISK